MRCSVLATFEVCDIFFATSPSCVTLAVIAKHYPQNMDKIFANKTIAKYFIITIISILVVLFLLRIWIIPNMDWNPKISDELISFIDKFNTSIITAVIVGLFMYFLQKDEKKKLIEFTDSSSEIENKLSKSRKNTEFWNFNGGLGRYTRQKTIIQLSEVASYNKKTINLKLILLNPENNDVLTKYISFRNSLNDKLNWTIETAREELLATIIQAAVTKKNNTFLEVEIYFKNYFTLSRMDISSTSAIITREDSKTPSIICNAESHMYKHYIEEFNQVRRQSNKVSLIKIENLNLKEINSIKNFITENFPNLNLTSKNFENISDKINNPVNPFK